MSPFGDGVQKKYQQTSPQYYTLNWSYIFMIINTVNECRKTNSFFFWLGNTTDIMYYIIMLYVIYYNNLGGGR